MINCIAAASGILENVLGFSEYGVLGMLVIILTIALIKKDRQVTALYSRLVQKAEKDTEKYHELAEELHKTLKELAEALEMVE